MMILVNVHVTGIDLAEEEEIHQMDAIVVLVLVKIMNQHCLPLIVVAQTGETEIYLPSVVMAAMG